MLLNLWNSEKAECQCCQGMSAFRIYHEDARVQHLNMAISNVSIEDGIHALSCQDFVRNEKMYRWLTSQVLISSANTDWK